MNSKPDEENLRVGPAQPKFLEGYEGGNVMEGGFLHVHGPLIRTPPVADDEHETYFVRAKDQQIAHWKEQAADWRRLAITLFWLLVLACCCLAYVVLR